MTSAANNPYRAPADETPVRDADPAKTPARKIFWSVVFAANLPIPVWFGTTVIPDMPGFLGMAAGSTLLYGAGLHLCAGPLTDQIRSVSIGGIVVALSQVTPVLQMYAGMLAISIASVFVGDSGRPAFAMSTAAGGVAMATFLTIVTGLQLIFVSWAGGALLTGLAQLLRR